MNLALALAWGSLNFVIYYDTGFDRALMVFVNFTAAAYLFYTAGDRLSERWASHRATDKAA